MTPDKTLKVSKKGFDAMVRRWRQALHRYDPPELANAQTQAGVAASSASNSNVVVKEPAAATAPEQQQQESAASPRGRAFSDPDLYDLDPARYAAASTDSASKGPSIFDNFEDDEALETAVDYEEDDDDDLL
ncbi:hypothetical protein PINS_up006785 [Pythium insidiosum]|nr:hypothetical protein PINS_up006785 [Pythium insidiosum]